MSVFLMWLAVLVALVQATTAQASTYYKYCTNNYVAAGARCDGPRHTLNFNNAYHHPVFATGWRFVQAR